MLTNFRRYPLAVFCITAILCVIVGVNLSSSVQLTAMLLVGILGIFLVILSFFRFGRILRTVRKSMIFGILGAVLAFLSCYFVCAKRNELPLLLAKQQASCQITAYAIEEGNDSVFGYTKIKVTNIDGKECDFDLVLERINLASPKPYYYFSAEVTFNTNKENLNQYAADNIAASAVVTELTASKKKVNTASAFFYRLANRIDKRLDTHLDGSAYAMARALLIGRNDSLPDTVKRDFRTLGISHTLAISGMHLTVLLAGVLQILGKLRTRKGLRAIISLILIVTYAGICGFTPSVLRAALMAVCLIAANVVGERTMGIRSLFLALCLILLVSPYLVFSLSLQLSSLATLGILCFFPLFHIKKEKHWARITHLGAFLLSQYCLTLCATVFTLPVMYFYFGSVSLISPVANIVFVPFITVLLYLLPVFCLSTFIPFFPKILGFIVEKVCFFILRASEHAVHYKDLYCHIPMIVLILCTLCVICIPILRRLRIKRCLAISILLLTLSLGITYPLSLLQNANLLYRYDGKREILLLGNHNSVLLIETGNASGQNAYTALTETGKILKQTGIDHVMLTHYHTASTNFVKYLLENTYVETVFLPRPYTEKGMEISETIIQISQQHKVKTHLYDQEEEINILDFSLRVKNETLHRAEHPAQGIEIVYQNSRILAADPALFELDGIGSLDLSGVDHLILLSSPPTDKYKLPPFSGAEGVHTIFGNQEQKKIVGCPFGSYTVLSPQKPYLFIVFS